MKEIKNKKKAFTLAEILITLSIIGVVAALTIPTLIQRTGNEEYVSRLLKTYSTLSQATEAIMTENGSVKTWASTTGEIYNLYKDKLRNSKECGSASGCLKNMKNQSYKFINSAQVDTPWNFDENSAYNKLILSDGVQVTFIMKDSGCSSNFYGSKDVCAWIYTDINGEKSPNTIGRDLFIFALKEDGLYPAGCDYDNVCTSSITKNNSMSEDMTKGGFGTGCACTVIREGAMNY